MNKSILPMLKKGLSCIWYEKHQECLLCGQKTREIICKDCREEYFLPGVNRCPFCGKLIEDSGTQCKDCREGKGPQNLDKVISLGYYHGAWKEFIHTIKFKSQPYLLVSLVELILPVVMEELPPPDRIVPVPMHPRRLAQRGFNQAEVLASVLGGKLVIGCEEILNREKDTTPQTILGRRERIKNLQGAFGLKEGMKVKGQVIWLIDDVVTTGTTIDECAHILKKNGVKEVYVFCLGAGKEESC